MAMYAGFVLARKASLVAQGPGFNTSNSYCASTIFDETRLLHEHAVLVWMCPRSKSKEAFGKVVRDLLLYIVNRYAWQGTLASSQDDLLSGTPSTAPGYQGPASKDCSFLHTQKILEPRIDHE